MPPEPKFDTADFRLLWYYLVPQYEFCYKWETTVQRRTEARIIYKTEQAIAKGE
jgi:hypothetical protein